MGIGDQRVYEEGLTLPMDKGDVLLMHKAMPHRSTLNYCALEYGSPLPADGYSVWEAYYPDFVVRSRSNPASVLIDYDEWCRRWIEALEERRMEERRANRWHVVL